MTVVSTVIIAHILTPLDYGVIAMVGPLFALIAMLQDLGLSTATVQARTLTWAQSNSMFWLNLVVSLALASVALAMAPLVIWFYDDTRPGLITAASAVTLLAGGLVMQHAALLNRDMQFAALGRIEIAEIVVTTGATIAFAIVLRSYWALFWER